MARIRSVHPGLFTDEAFVSLSHSARLLFIGLWTEADDRGIFQWKPVRFKMRLFPADAIEIEDLLAEMLKGGIVLRFESDDKAYGAIRNFCRWQRPRSPQYLHPATGEAMEWVAFNESETDEQPKRGRALHKHLCEQQGGACFYCGGEITHYAKKANSLQIDHKVPVSAGGADDIENLVAACKPCSALKSDLSAEEFLSQFSRDQIVSNAAAKGIKFDHSHPTNGAKNNNSHCEPKFAAAKTEKPPQMEDEGGRREELFSEPNGSAPKTAQQALTDTLWREGPTKLGKLGLKEPRARSQIGKWLKTSKPEEVLRAIEQAERNGTQDPIPYITAALKPDARPWRRTDSGQYAIRPGTADFERLKARAKAQNSPTYYDFTAAERDGTEVCVTELYPK